VVEDIAYISEFIDMSADHIDFISMFTDQFASPSSISTDEDISTIACTDQDMLVLTLSSEKKSLP